MLRFRLHRVPITADVGKMEVKPTELLKDYWMTRVAFGVSALSFAANMSVRQNALDLAHKFPLAAKVVEDCFYIDDCLTGANTIERAILLLKSIDPGLQDSLEVLNISGSKPLGWNGTPHWITFA